MGVNAFLYQQWNNAVVKAATGFYYTGNSTLTQVAFDGDSDMAVMLTPDLRVRKLV